MTYSTHDVILHSDEGRLKEHCGSPCILTGKNLVKCSVRRIPTAVSVCFDRQEEWLDCDFMYIGLQEARVIN